VYGGTGLVGCDGTSPAKMRCAINVVSVLHEGVDDASEVSGDPTNMTSSAMSIYANGSGREGSVSKGSVNANGEPKDAADLAESGCGELDNVGVIVRVG